MKQIEIKEKNKKRFPQKNEKAFRKQALKQKSHQRDKHQGSPPRKILGAIPKIDKRGTQRNQSIKNYWHKDLHWRDDKYWMRQKSKKEEDSPAIMIAQMHQHKDSKTT